VLHSAYLMLRLLCRWLLPGVLGIFTALPGQSQDFTYAAVQLSAKINDRVAPGPGSLSISNRSSLNNQTVSLIRAELLRALQARGWKLEAAQQKETTIAITLAENYRNYIWTAEILKAGSREIGIVELPKSAVRAQVYGDRVLLSRYALISSEGPLLDVALLEGRIGEGSHLVALAPTTIQLYQMQSNEWRLMQSQPLGREPKPSRDLRGRIVPGAASSFDAFLPASRCTGTFTNSLTVTCRDSDDPWPLGDDRQLLAFYAANRNYFNGVISGGDAQGGNVEPFFSAAVLSDGIVYARTDGRASVAISRRAPTPVPAAWGSNIVAIQGVCQSDLVIASAAGDSHQADEITAFRLGSSDVSVASEPLSFEGPVLSLKSLADRREAIAVVASPSGRYEAYLLTARCGA